MNKQILSKEDVGLLLESIKLIRSFTALHEIHYEDTEIIDKIIKKEMPQKYVSGMIMAIANKIGLPINEVTMPEYFNLIKASYYTPRESLEELLAEVGYSRVYLKIEGGIQ